MENIKSIVLLLTGCITSSTKVPFLALKNPAERRKQVIDSIKFYITHTSIENIVYCDNSNAFPDFELGLLATTNRKKFEWISFEGNQKMSEQKGKGYGEGEIVDYAIEHSRLLKKENVYIIKVTSRLIVENIELLLQHISLDRLYFSPMFKNYIDTKVYMMPKKIYRNFFSELHLSVEDVKGRYLEYIFAECIKSKKIKYNRFIVAPKIMGVSGTFGVFNKMSWWEWFIRTVRMYLIRI